MSHCGRPSSCSSVTSAAAWVPRVPRVSWQHLQKPWSLWCLYGNNMVKCEGKIWEIHQFNEIYNGFMWINWIYNHLSAKLSLSLYMRDCHCFFPVPFIFHQLWETEHTSVKIWGTQATEHPGTGGFQSDCNDRTKQTKHWPKSVGKWLVLFLQSKYCVFLPKKSQCFFGQKPCKLRR